MPRTKKQLVKQIPGYKNKVAYYQLSKHFAGTQSNMGMLLGDGTVQQYIQEKEEIDQAQIINHGGMKRIKGIEFTDQSLSDEGIKKLYPFLQKWNNKLAVEQSKQNGIYSDFHKDNFYIVDGTNGDMVRAILDNPPLLLLPVAYGGGFTTFERQSVADPGDLTKQIIIYNDVSENTANTLGESLNQALNDFYHGVRMITEAQFERQQDLDNYRGLQNEKQYLSKYKTAIQATVSAYERIVEEQNRQLDEQGKPKEFRDVLQNELSELTAVNLDHVRQHVPCAIGGLKAQIHAIDMGWGADELGVMSYIGETEEEIALQKRFLEKKKLKRDNEKNEEERRQLTEEIDKTSAELAGVERDFQKLKEEVYNVNVTNRRDLKIEITKKIQAFDQLHKGEKGIYDVSCGQGIEHPSSIELTADSVLDPYGMAGLSRAEQLSGIMEDLDEVDGTFQHSSENFRKLRGRLKELKELADKFGEEMTREQMDLYLEKIEEVKAAGRVYLAGKEREAAEYANSHRGRKIAWKDITKSRMGFVTNLEERLNAHIENAVGKFMEDGSIEPNEHALALLARRMRKEERIRASLAPKKAVRENHAFVSSVYRSLYLEYVYTKFRNEEGYDAKKMEADLTEEKIAAGAVEMKNLFETGKQNGLIDINVGKLNYNGRILTNINQRIALGNREFGRDFINTVLYDVMAVVHKEGKNGAHPISNAFGFWNNIPPAANPNPNEKYGFGRYYDDYFDRDDETGISKIQQTELKLGFREETAEELNAQKAALAEKPEKINYALIFPKDGYLDKFRNYLRIILKDKATFGEDGSIRIKENALNLQKNNDVKLAELVESYNNAVSMEKEKLTKDRVKGWNSQTEKDFKDRYIVTFGTANYRLTNYGLQEAERMNNTFSAEYTQAKDAVSQRLDFVSAHQTDLPFNSLFPVSERELSTNELLLNTIPDGNLSEAEIRQYTRNYFMNEYFATIGANDIEQNPEKVNHMGIAIKELTDDMNISGMNGKELKELLVSYGKSEAFTEFLANASAASDVALHRASDPKTIERANEYRKLVESRAKRIAEERKEKRLLAESVELKPKRGIAPKEKLSTYLQEMMKSEEETRKQLLDRYENGENLKEAEKMEIFRQIVSSACRSLYAEKLQKEYPLDNNLGAKALETNEKSLRMALERGFADKNNADAFKTMMKTPGFGDNFQKILLERGLKKGTLTHEDINSIKEFAIGEGLKEAAPEENTKWAKNNAKANRKANRLDSIIDHDKIENIKRIVNVLGTEKFGSFKTVRTFADKENPNLIKVKLQTAYKTPVKERNKPMHA